MQKLFSVVVSISFLVGCSVQSVDVAQPVAVADKFYGALGSGDGQAALAQFSPEFKSHVETWPRLLDGLQQRYGPATAVELRGSSPAANDEGPCYSLDYAVSRSALASTEILFLCSKGGQTPWLIRGHRLTRLDTQQTVTGGVLPTERSIQLP